MSASSKVAASLPRTEVFPDRGVETGNTPSAIGELTVLTTATVVWAPIHLFASPKQARDEYLTTVEIEEVSESRREREKGLTRRFNSVEDLLKDLHSESE